MARLLRRLGSLSHRLRHLVVGVWLALVVLLGAGFATWGDDLSDEFSVPGSESQVAIDTVAEEFPGAEGATVQVVMTAPAGTTLSEGPAAAAVRADLAAVADVPGVAGVVTPEQSGRISSDGTVATADVRLTEETNEVSDDILDAVEDAWTTTADAGVDVDFTGSAYSAAVSGTSHAAEVVGVLLALVIVGVTVGSVVAAGLPVLTALLGVAVGLLGIFLASTQTAVSTNAPALATMLGLAVGIDYALLMLVRHRSELAWGSSVPDAVATTTGTAGTSVVFAGSTVVIALLGLGVTGLPFLTVMGIAAAGMVLVSVLVAVTLVPALLGLLGERLRPRAAARADGQDEPSPARAPAGERWVRAIARRPKRVLVAGVLALGVLAVPVASMELALPDNGGQPTDTSARQGYDTVEETFGAGANGPLLVLADTSASQDPEAAAAAVADELAGTDGVAQVAPPRLSEDGSHALVTVVPETGPSDAETRELVDEIRAGSDDLAASTGATVQVTGSTAQGIDVSSLLQDAIVPFALVVVGLSFLLLVLVFGSILVPLVAAVGYLLSLGAALGVTVAVFQWGWLGDGVTSDATGPLVSFSPVIIMAVLFGLAMDYQLFYVSRVHEAVQHGADARDAIGIGGRHSARVVVAAALIMLGVFGSFVVAGSATIASIALALAVGVVVDALVVRLTLVPASLGLLGDAAWWLPGWLRRRLPRLDVEGAAVDADTTPGEPDLERVGA